MTDIIRLLQRHWLIRVVLIANLVGCSQQRPFIDSSKQASDVDLNLIKQVSYEETVPSSPEGCGSTCSEPPPFDLDSDSASVAYWDMTLDEAIQTALSNSTVLRDLGARIIQAPNLTPTIYGPSIVATDPRFSEEAALAAFDAQFMTRAFYEKNDRVLNNSLLGGGTNFFVQDLWRIESQLRKRAATGTTFTLRHNIEDDYNNSPSNIFGSASNPGHAWTWITEAEIRQPLLQRAGVDFNRIAGVDSTPGVYNGVVVARINTEISAGDFQLALRNYLSNVENAYWELVFAYRDLDVKKSARDHTLKTWQELKARTTADVPDDKVAQAAEQYFRFKQEVETALSGVLLDGTRDFNGSTGGTFQGTGGVYVAERRLRLIMGTPINDGRLIRPTTEPSPAEVAMNWDEMATASLAQRVELVQQRLRIKRSNLELTANQNFLKPELDLVGRYRLRGFSNKLYVGDFINPPNQFVDSDKSEWQFGMELNMPFGFRQAHVGVRNAQLVVSRERAVLADMERQVIHDVSNALAEKTRTFQQVQTAYNRRVSAQKQLDILNRLKADHDIDFNVLLDSERRLAEAESDYHRAVVSYAVALKNVYVETGSLLEYCNVHYSDKEG